MSPIAAPKAHNALRSVRHRAGLTQKTLSIKGPRAIVRELNDLIDQHADGLVAIVEEFSSPVSSAESLLRHAR